MKKIKLSLVSQIGLALILGFIVGFLMQDYVDIAKTYIKPIGDIFLNLLKFIVVPLVLLSIICSIISMKDMTSLGRLGVRSLCYFMVTTVLAVTMGLCMSTWLSGYFPTIELVESAEPLEAPTITLMDQIMNFFPKNIIDPVLNNAMMQVIVIAIAIGFAIVKVGEKAKPVADFVESANEITVTILGFIMSMAPFGVFCLLCPVVAENGTKILGTYASLIGVTYLCFAIHAVVVYSGAVALLAKMNPLRFFKHMGPAMLFAYSSDSSLATLPVNMKCTEKLGVRESIRNFVLPMGATINMDGVAIYLGVTAVFIAKCCGVELGLNEYISIALACTIASIGTPGIPGGALALMAMVFASAGIPLEGVALVAGIDRIVDMGRTTMSITGDASCAVVMEHIERDNKNL